MEIYVCDSNNKRIQILSKHFKFISKFGEDSLSEPLDIKLSKDYIYVLDVSNPCVYLFDYDHILQKRHIIRGNGMLVSNPYFFFIDDSNIYSFLTMDLILFFYSILFLNSFTRFLYQIILQELLYINKEGLLLSLVVTTIVFKYFDISYFDFVHSLF